MQPRSSDLRLEVGQSNTTYYSDFGNELVTGPQRNYEPRRTTNYMMKLLGKSSTR